MQSICIDGPAGDLEIEVKSDSLDLQPSRFAVLCHPHPLYGGNMNDAVVSAMEDGLIRHGLSTLRFNFRGVGRSQGSHDQGLGEVEDLLAAIRWLNKEHPSLQLVLGGYSFGAMVALKAAGELKEKADITAEQIILIAPPVTLLEGQFGEGLQRNISCPCNIILGTQDEFVPLQETKAWFGDMSSPSFTIVDNADHFFVGRAKEISGVMSTLVDLVQ